MRKRRGKLLALLLAILIVFPSVLGIVSFVLVSINVDYEKDEMLFEAARSDTSAVYYAYDVNGELDKYYVDTSRGAKEWCSFENVGEYIKLGFISMEDREFYDHSGINLKRTLLAFLNHVFHIGKRFGASTITQQVVKNISGDNDFTAKRKIKEILRALRIEHRHTKDEIFELYLNIVPMSNNIYGVGSAAEFYFGKGAGELTLAESALLVGITNAPSRYDPIRNPEAARDKRNRVLFAMLDAGYISREEYEVASAQDLELRPENKNNSFVPWYIECAEADIIKDLINQYNVSMYSARLMLRGSKIILTVDTRVQGILESYFSCEDNFSEKIKDGLDYGMIVYSKTGDVAGIVGGVGKKRASKLLNLALADITPASAMKPLALYAPIIDLGMLNSASLIKDLPIYYRDTENGVVGYPRNSPNVYSGAVTLADAVSYSKNTCAVEIYNMLGRDKIINTLKTCYGFDISEEDTYMASLALGEISHGITLRSLTHSYTAFLNNGVLNGGRTYECVIKKDGDVLIENRASEVRIMKRETAEIMTSLLEGVVEYGTARSIKLKNVIDTAGKTGTASGDKSRVFIGYTPCYAAGIWTGYRSGSRAVGNNTPSHISIWDDIMNEIHTEILSSSCVTPFFQRDDVVRMDFSAESGDVWCYECDEDINDRRVGYFSKDNLPTDYCDIHGVTQEYVPAYLNTEWISVSGKKKKG